METGLQSKDWYLGKVISVEKKYILVLLEDYWGCIQKKKLEKSTILKEDLPLVKDGAKFYMHTSGMTVFYPPGEIISDEETKEEAGIEKETEAADTDW